MVSPAPAPPGPAPGPAAGRDADGSKGAQTRRAILDAAIVRFGREGYRSTSVADIARDAGVGGTVTYAYFANKEALFLAALDEDAAAVIEEGVSSILGTRGQFEWRTTFLLTLLEAIDGHPLTRRVLSGLEPHVTSHMLGIPALEELRKAVADRLRSDQLAGLVRADVDPVRVGNGAITITLALLMAVLQFGRDGLLAHGPDVLAVFEAALDAPPSTP